MYKILAYVGDSFLLLPEQIVQEKFYGEKICKFDKNKIRLETAEKGGVIRLPQIYAIKDFHSIVALKLSCDKIVVGLLVKSEWLIIPLCITKDLKNVMIAWRCWARYYNLPIYLIDHNNKLLAVKETDSLEYLRAHKASFPIFIRFHSSIANEFLLTVHNRQAIA